MILWCWRSSRPSRGPDGTYCPGSVNEREIVMRKAVIAAAAGAAILAFPGAAAASAGAVAVSVGNPGVLSGNVVQVPVHIPVNVVGDSVNVIGVLNPAFGNQAANG